MNKELNICKNCKNKFVGNFCNICGEKKILDTDFAIKNI
jgi:recombinational DNA repair protein RecR